MEGEPTLEERQPKARNEYKAPARSVSEYAYTEDGNFYYRDAMEDGKYNLLFISKTSFIKTILSETISLEMDALASLESSMVTVAIKFQDIVLKQFLMYSNQ